MIAVMVSWDTTTIPITGHSAPFERLSNITYLKTGVVAWQLLQVIQTGKNKLQYCGGKLILNTVVYYVTFDIFQNLVTLIS